MMDALYQSLVIFFIAYGAYLRIDVGLWEFGTTLITSSLCVMLLHQAVETKSWVSRQYRAIEEEIDTYQRYSYSVSLRKDMLPLV